MKKREAEEYLTHSERETFLVAQKLAKSFKGDEVILLEGELGAGKTVFAKGIASGLGLKNFHQVCSPSYTLVNIYQAKYPIYHIDLFRLSKDSEILDIGWEEYLGQGVIVVEWAEKLRFPLEAIRIRLEIEDGEKRRIIIDP